MTYLIKDLHAGMRIRKAHIFPILSSMELNGKKILDAGCGRGDYSFFLARRFPGAIITAVDFDTVQIESNKIKAEKQKLKNLNFIQGDLTGLELTEKYDLMISVDVFEHIMDDAKAFKLLYSLLRNDGILLLHVPLDNRRSYLTTRYEFFIQEDHARDGYNENDLHQKLKMAGFQSISKQYTFGRFGTAAWEIFKLAGEVSRILQWFTIISTMVLAWLEIHSPRIRGNSVLVLARKQ